MLPCTQSTATEAARDAGRSASDAEVAAVLVTDAAASCRQAAASAMPSHTCHVIYIDVT